MVAGNHACRRNSPSLRQYLLGRHYDMGVTLFVFVGFYYRSFQYLMGNYFADTFGLGGIYILFREYLESKEESLEEEEEDMNQEDRRRPAQIIPMISSAYIPNVTQELVLGCSESSPKPILKYVRYKLSKKLTVRISLRKEGYRLVTQKTAY